MRPQDGISEWRLSETTDTGRSHDRSHDSDKMVQMLYLLIGMNSQVKSALLTIWTVSEQLYSDNDGSRIKLLSSLSHF